MISSCLARSAAVTVATTKPNTDPAYNNRGRSERLKRISPARLLQSTIWFLSAMRLTLCSGEIYFAPLVEGRVTAAVFIGDGEMA